MKSHKDKLTNRIEALKATLWADSTGRMRANPPQGAVQSTLTILASIYGTNSLQVGSFQKRIQKGVGQRDGIDTSYDVRVAEDIESVLSAASADLDSGLSQSIQATASGEVLGDFVALARTALDENTVGSDRVAAVLSAAALEETLKRLGDLNGVAVYDRDMRGVIQKLTDAEILKGPTAKVASGYVVFRD